MIKATFYYEGEKITGFKVLGHAGFAEYGHDIVCAAVSMLVLNTVNSIEAFTESVTAFHEEESKGAISLMVEDPSEDAELLLKSLKLGLDSVRKEYGKKYIEIKTSQNHKEV